MAPSKSYADLDGAQGRGVFFRPPRFRPADLGPVLPMVELYASSNDAGSAVPCTMHDVSQNGVAFTWPSGRAIELGMMVPLLTVTFDHHEAYRGAAAVTSVREVDGEQIVGVSFVDTLMNIEDVLHLRDVKSWSHGGARELVAASKPWHVTGHATYKALVGEFRLFLEDASKSLAEMEETLPWHVVHGESDSAARDELLRYLREQFVEEFLRFATEIDTVERDGLAGERPALREFSLRNLQPFLMLAPFFHRAAQKPLGYPGDFELMRFIYERPFEGATLFAKALHLAAVATPGAALVRSRKDMLKRHLLARLAEATKQGVALKICSIASGPAQEIHELLLEADPSVCAEIVLFDQDHGALTLAYSRLRKLVAARHTSGVRITYLHDSIKRLLRDETIFEGVAPFDVILCAGLLDYLDVRNATALCRSLFADLTVGGSAYVGNVVPEMPSRWLMEDHLDWVLRYKSRDELLSIARAAAPDGDHLIIEESTGWNPFVVLTRTRS